MLLIPVLAALAAPLGHLPVQGLLSGPDGAPLTGPQSVIFVLSGDGAPILTEPQTVIADLGLFSARLGGTNGFDLEVLGQYEDLTLSVSVGGIPSPAVPVGWAPRAAYAAHAGHAATASDAAQLDGHDASYFATSSALDLLSGVVDGLSSALSSLSSTVSGLEGSLAALDTRQASDTEVLLDLTSGIEGDVASLNSRLETVELSNLGFVGSNCAEGSYVIGFAEDGSVQCSPAGVGFATVSAGIYHACSLLTDKTVRCWGYGANGRLGNKGTANYNTPVAVKTSTALLSKVIHLSVGYSSTCAVVGATDTATSGTVACWGTGTAGMLGTGATTDVKYASPVVGITNAVRVSVGYQHACALLSTGGAKCWGAGGSGVLGNGLTTNSSVPVDVKIGGTITTDLTDISAGGQHTCVVRSNGAAMCVGTNTYGQLGDNTTTTRTVLTAIPTLTSGVRRIYAVASYQSAPGWYNWTCAIKTDNTLWCWGRNGNGQLGDGTTTQRNVPVQALMDFNDDAVSEGAITDVVDFAGGGIHSCVIAGANRNAFCAGWNGTYAVANLATTQRLLFTAVRNEDDSDVLADIQSVGAGKYQDSTFSVWTRLTPPAITPEALAMGANSYGQLGDNTTTATTGIPVLTVSP